MKTFLMRLTLLAAALPLFATPAQEEPEAASGPAAGNEWFVGSGVPVQYNSPAEYEAATGRTLEYGEAPVLAALVASGDLPPVGERLPNDPIVIAPAHQIGIAQSRPDGAQAAPGQGGRKPLPRGAPHRLPVPSALPLSRAALHGGGAGAFGGRHGERGVAPGGVPPPPPALAAYLRRLTGATGTWSADVYDYPMNPFIYNDGTSYRYMNANKIVDFNANKPEWREGLRYMRGLYAQGLVDPQAFTQNLDAARAVTNTEPYMVGSYTAGHNRMFPRNDDLWPQYRAVPPLMGPTGLRQTAYWPSGVDRGKFAITDRASDIQARKAMEMANYAYTEEGTIREIWGIPVNSEGVVNWRYAEEGEYGLNGKPGIVWGAPHAWGDTPRQDAWMMELIFWHFDLFNGWVADQDITKVEGYERFLVLESDKYIPHVPAPDMRVPIGRGTSGGLYFPEEVAQRIAQIQAEVQTYVRQNMAAFITGQKDLDTEWDAYVAGLDALGIQEYVDTFQEAMDAAAALQ